MANFPSRNSMIFIAFMKSILSLKKDMMAFLKVGSTVMKDIIAFFYTKMCHCSTLSNFIQNISKIQDVGLVQILWKRMKRIVQSLDYT